MARSIWKRGERMTRPEKKKLRKLMPHPNRGRRLYQWKVECCRIGRSIAKGLNNGVIDWADIVNVPTEEVTGGKPKSRIAGACPDFHLDGITEICCLSPEEADDETYALPAQPSIVVGTGGKPHG